MNPSPAVIAKKFIEGLRADLNPATMDEIVARNKIETSVGVCHTHDFCDANVYMAEALESFGIDPLDAIKGGQPHWTAAWNAARLAEFDEKKLELP